MYTAHRIIGENMIEVGDLVRFKGNQTNTSRDGIWLVMSIEKERINRGPKRYRDVVTLIKGSKRRRERAHVLMKISSCREKIPQKIFPNFSPA